MNYEEARAKIQANRENTYGSQWMRHLDRYGPVAYFYEMVGIMGRLESLIVDDNIPEGVPEEVLVEAIQDKLVDLGNYASFIHDWMEVEMKKLEHELFKAKLP